MSIVHKIMKRPRALTEAQEQLILDTYGERTTASGAAITTETAMQAMAVHSCIRILSNSVAMLPAHLMREAEDGQKTKAKDVRLYRLLHDQPNDWQTAPEFWQMCMAHLLLRGNFIALKSTVRGELRELIPMQYDSVQEITQDEKWRLWYKIKRPNGDIDEIPQRQVFHVRGLTVNGVAGVNPIEYARESIGLALQTEKHGAKLFSNGARLGGILMYPGKIGDSRRKDLEQQFADQYASAENAHKTALLEEGMKWQQVSMSSEDAQFLESRRFQKKEIVDLFFSMPLSLLMADDTNPTFASAEQFGLSYVTYAITPWLVGIEKAVYRDLLTDAEKKQYYLKFQTGALLRSDMKTRYEAHDLAITAGWKKRNEVRNDEDMNEIAGLDDNQNGDNNGS